MRRVMMTLSVCHGVRLCAAWQVRIKCMWALSNLAWNGSNQERIGRFYTELFDLCEYPDVGVHSAGCTPGSCLQWEGERIVGWSGAG